MSLRTLLTRFVVVGGANTALGFVVFHAALAWLGTARGGPALAQTIAYVVGTGVSFLLNRGWTFRSGGPVRRELRRFVATQVALLVATSALIDAGVAGLGLNSTLCWLAVMAGATVTNFVVQRRWVFAPATPPGADGAPPVPGHRAA